ncbi:MAG: ABC transporter transmembrane domain-containing protein, partial [Deltaproteobacteria bacterium]|nr:ABC transporter transmembrane domain-containing protein [Deltaproteobacteria bacterium]
APAWYIKDVVDTLEGGDTPPIQKFVLVGLAIVLIFSVRGLFFYGHNYLIGAMALRMVTALRMEMYVHLHSLSFFYFTGKSRGALISRFTNDLNRLQEALTVSILAPLRDIPQLLLMLAILGYRSWQLALLSLVLIPIALSLISLFGRRNNKFTRDTLSTFGHMTTLLVETISGIRVVKAFSMEKYEADRYEESNNLLLGRALRTLNVTSYSTPVLETIGAIAGAIIVMFGGFLIIHKDITGGDFASFLFTFFLLNEPIKKLNGFTLKINEGMAAAHRVFELLDTPPDVTDKPDAKPLPVISKNISIQIDRHYYRVPEDPVLQNIHMEIKTGEVVALVGPSGAGKTTLVNLIPRFFDLKEGSISIDGHNILDVTLDSLRGQIAIVTQEVFLFNDTVANNIAYGKIDCPRERIEEAAKAAHAYGFIMELPQGFDTPVGEGGMHLSGGQRQRLAIARALIKNAPILILDEATSALDSESEQEVQEAIEALLEDRTTIVIAHRLSTIRKANRIYVLEKGKVVEEGRHGELLALGGMYTKLYEMQFRDAPEEDRGEWWADPKGGA